MRGMRPARDGIDHHLAVAVVGGDDHRAARLLKRGDNTGKALIHRLAGLDRGPEIAGMADHVGVGIVRHDQVIARLDGADEMIGDLLGRHLGLKIIGRNLGRRGHIAILARLGRFLAAVEEEGDVGIFLGFGKVELGHTLFGHPFAQRVDDRLFRENRVHIGVVLVGILGHSKHRVQAGTARHIESGEGRIADGGEDLAHPVSAEVEGEKAVALFHPREIANDSGGQEFIGLAIRIARLDGGGSALRSRSHAPALDHQAIGLFDPLPAIIAVHCEVAAYDGDDLGPLRQSGFQSLDLPDSRFRRHIAPVGDGVDCHGDASLADHPRGFGDMRLMRMDAPGRGKADKMRGAARSLHLGDEALQRGALAKAAIFDRQVDLPEVHRHNAACADVGMAHLGIAHLAGRQANIGAMGDEFGMGAGGQKPVEGRRICQKRGIGGRVFALAPAVEDTKNNRFVSAHHGLHRCALLAPNFAKRNRQPEPIRAPAAKTSAPPRTTWNVARRNGVSI